MAETRGASRKPKTLPKRKVAALRKLLEAERVQLVAQISRLEADFRHESWKEPRSDDDAETGSATFERERMMSLAHNARGLLSEIDRALGRIDAGTYGHCQSCGELIADARLEALPQAEYCLECKRKAERTSR
jgi:DnaK suppressor protein